ncbi:helicase [Actinocatenispora thailandica]|uniref:Helicase n=1 Tax=Actinocatenispora thailandica TaxID=227318 RepID=A0A7R7HZI9_9ACTN|nr:DEAD/DEAH box helicase [Actinocatenispora thailandica]BCJ37163.1 helicase [Actinocatenispora thailandica]
MNRDRSELLPTLLAANVRAGLTDYLTTTFGLTDGDARDNLGRFLRDPVDGMFKGPYLRLRLPFRPAQPGWESLLEWYDGPEPYGHQAAAFARLSSSVDGRGRRPLPTLVTTGTGSGKTEAFLMPIVDHVRRARRAGVTGTKALILYPMNALANDQAGRLTRLLTGHPELAGITAALYTGEGGPTRVAVDADGLITDREIVRDDPPDILLTNYKMLDQLLLRAADQPLWAKSATSLTYLVLDEFHTYDGAQGTDVAMLLRRLGLALKSHWPADDPSIDAADRARPLGRITPVATSATLGDKGDPAVMREFAETVFGERFDADAVVTETRLGVEEWVDAAPSEVAAAEMVPVPADAIDLAAATAAIEALGFDPPGGRVADTMLGLLYDEPPTRFTDADARFLLAASRAHPMVQDLARHAADATPLPELAAAVAGPDPRWVTFLSYLAGALGHVRARAGRGALSVEVHLWVRELVRIDRAAGTTARFHWFDDGPPAGADEESRPMFPAIYCRHCGRSGWGVGLAPVGLDLAVDDDSIRSNHRRHDGRFRALLYAPAEAEAHFDGEQRPDGLLFLDVHNRRLVDDVAADDPDLADGWTLPVLTTSGDDADRQAQDDFCPSCRQDDGIRFLGSAVATLLSVSLSTMFGSAVLDTVEKKALVFTDSVQDAAHRAGFVQARSHTLTLRAVLRQAVGDSPRSLDAVVSRAIELAGDDPFARYRLLPPELADREAFAPFWQAATLSGVPASVANRVRLRLALDAALEFGLNSRIGRPLELTGSATVEVDAGTPGEVAAMARASVDGTDLQLTIDGAATEAALVRWVRGTLDRMRAQGAIDHQWFGTYRTDDGKRWWLTGGRPRHQGMPAFGRNRPAPAYPRVGGAPIPKDSGLQPVGASQSWYARWTARALGVAPHDGARLARMLLAELDRRGVLKAETSRSGATVYAIRPERIVVAAADLPDLEAGRHLLSCDTCRTPVPGSVTSIDQLDGGPCLLGGCRGQLTRAPIGDNFYRRLYDSTDMRRVVSREHTSLLDDATRREYEDGFKSPDPTPQSPNVLVATPTLEMGIDIGDLSTVLLGSLPRTVASYLQRVGRAGRQTGNALDLAYVSGRGEQLPKLGDPLSVVNGEVRPPATYLSAEEILRRQYTAHLVDSVARDPGAFHPQRATQAIGRTAPGSFLGDLIDLAESTLGQRLPGFVDAMGGLPDDVVDRLRAWLSPAGGRRTSPFAAHVRAASERWNATIQELETRRTRIETLLPELRTQADSPAHTDDDEREVRSAESTLKLVRGQLAALRTEYWIGVLEEYGLLPNYTLLDDTAVLDVGLSWTDPDTDQFQYRHDQFQRASAQAIREFAPGATFYARGMEISIDAVDLGLDGAAIRPWVFCPDCGYAADLAATGVEVAVARCPRCGSRGIADVGSRLDVVELTRVSAEIRRDESTISDRRDERRNAPFTVLAAADVDPAHIGRRWFADNTGLGVTYLHTMDLRWLNIGLTGRGTTRRIAGADRTGEMFRVCEGCGKKDSDSGHNSPREHRPWCRFRTSTDEHTRRIALSRKLRTQGVVVRLPNSVTVGDDFAVPSLAAALQLGLREQLGGDPDHLLIENIVDPTSSDGSDNHEALLIHDTVPGGTGYLAEVAVPDNFRDLLVRAWEKVRDCECQNEDRLACHRCLLPFISANSVRRVSRASADRHLRTLLGLPDDASDPSSGSWQVGEVPPQEEPESHLEQRLRRLLLGWLRRQGAAIEEVPGQWGNAVRFTLPGTPRHWTLLPQEQLGEVRADFVLRCNDTNVPPVVVFTDGRGFHATTTHNRIADDARIRTNLRDAGQLVVSLTHDDVLAAEHAARAEPPDWYDDQLVGQLQSMPMFQASPDAYRRLAANPVEWLQEWVREPSPRDLTQVAHGVSMMLNIGSQQVSVEADATLADVGRAVLLERPIPPGPRKVQVRRVGPMVTVVEMVGTALSSALVLDDRDAVMGDGYAQAWQRWLRLANSVAASDWPVTVTTVGLGAVEEPAVPERVARPGGRWGEIFDEATPGPERDLVVTLAERDITPPQVGAEGPDGIPLSLAWPAQRLTVAFEQMPDTDRDDLAEAGWDVVEPQPDAVVAALTGRE